MLRQGIRVAHREGRVPVRVAVIGGGAAGLAAAIAAARGGASVTVLEKGDRVGRKLLATGNGRCNLTNLELRASRYHGSVPGFTTRVLERYGAQWALDFFGRLGIHPVVEDCGRVFPRSGQAGSVLDVLRWEVESLGVRVACDAAVREVRCEGPGFRILAGTDPSLDADRVVLATGGRAAPSLGSDGSGYALARAFGHPIVDPFQALVPLRLSSPWLRALDRKSVV